MAAVLDGLSVRFQLGQPGEGDLLSFTLEAELLPEPLHGLVGASDLLFEKEVAALESAE